MTTNEKKFDYKKFLRKNRVSYLNYITHINNLDSILHIGILSRNEVEQQGLKYERIDWESVQNFRKGHIKNIHDFVPLFFATHTPMLYVTCHDGDLQNDIAIIKIDIGILENRDVSFSDKNCAKYDVNLYTDLSDLTNLKWDIINTKNCWSPNFRAYKSAEVLVYNKVELPFIHRVYVATQETKNRIDNMVQTERKGIINVKPDEFY